MTIKIKRAVLKTVNKTNIITVKGLMENLNVILCAGLTKSTIRIKTVEVALDVKIAKKGLIALKFLYLACHSKYFVKHSLLDVSVRKC